ncbi:hypothetical protein B7494_g7628 [Chlorociboria aeruginascens]|nr:hypothetical protein B7494_g7628 [Chlorociboria aeruginascens]
MGFFKLAWLAIYTLILSATALVTPERVEERWNKQDNVQRLTLTLTWGPGAPDGNNRDLIYTNGQFPGPSLVFDENDQVEITVLNLMPFNATVHWHGLLMEDTNYSDGVPGLTQKPIEPRSSYIYRFSASPPGTYWYHSHTRATLLDGLYGAIYIRPKAGSPAPWSLISNSTKDIKAMTAAAADPTLVVVSDWNKFTSWDYLAAEEASNLDIFCRDSVLINGKGSVYCPGLDYLIPFVPEQLAATLDNQTVTDKGCLPFVYGTEGPYLPGNPSAIPPGLQSGCVASNGSVPVVEVDASSGWVSVNLVMAATFMSSAVSIDDHDLWIYEVDGHYIEPYKAQAVFMYPGERYAAMVKVDKKPGDYTLRAPASISQIFAAYGIFRYKNSPPKTRSTLQAGVIPTGGYVNYGGEPTAENVTILDGGYTHLPPFPPTPPAQESDDMFVFSLGRFTAPWKWTFSGKQLMPTDASAYDPILYDPHNDIAMNPNLTIRTTNGSWVDLVLRVGALPGEPQEINHAIHKHGSKMWFIGQGTGIWNYSSVAEGIAAEPESFNLVNPTYRDTIMTTFTGSAWFVLRYQVTNPGAWLLHCHVEIHLAGGMGIAILDGVDKWPQIPPEYALNQNGYPVGGHNYNWGGWGDIGYYGGH